MIVIEREPHSRHVGTLLLYCETNTEDPIESMEVRAGGSHRHSRTAPRDEAE